MKLATSTHSYTQARKRLKQLLGRAADDHEIVIVRRRGGGDVAMIAADELSSLLETVHLLRSPANAQRLLTALARARGPDASEPTSLDTRSAARSI